jgi:hypothetical protein
VTKKSRRDCRPSFGRTLLAERGLQPFFGVAARFLGFIEFFVGDVAPFVSSFLHDTTDLRCGGRCLAHQGKQGVEGL